MFRPGLIVTAVVVAACAASCATTETQGGQEGYQEKAYVTGSRIPVKDKDAVKPTEQREVDEFMRQRQIGAPRGGGG
jgi:hypothetical protein